MIERKALMEREKREREKKKDLLSWLQNVSFLIFLFCSYGNDENIHIRTQRETSNMWTHLRTAAAVSLFRFFFIHFLCSILCDILLWLLSVGGKLTYVDDDDDVAADAWQRTIHSHFPWQHRCHLDREGYRAIIKKKGQVLIPKKEETQSGNII